MLRALMSGGLVLVIVTGCTSSHRNATVEPVREVPGLTVSVTPSGNVGWQLAIRNTGAAAAKLVWDESTYVNTAGNVVGRLLRGQTRKIHSDREQPPTPIPPGSSLTEWCVPEGHMEAVGSFYTPKVENPGGRGRLILVFEFDGGQKKNWEGSVTFDDAKTQPATKSP